MIDKDKVKLMTQIAIYEKNHGRTDEKLYGFSQKDFISFNNFKMQLSITIVLVLIFAGEFSILAMKDLDTLSLNSIISLGIKYIIVWLIFLIIYTFNLTRINKKYYNKYKGRNKKYEEMLDILDKMEAKDDKTA